MLGLLDRRAGLHRLVDILDLGDERGDTRVARQGFSRQPLGAFVVRFRHARCSTKPLRPETHLCFCSVPAGSVHLDRGLVKQPASPTVHSAFQ